MSNFTDALYNCTSKEQAVPDEAVKPGHGCEAHMYHCCPPGPRIESQHNDDSDSIREICPSTGCLGRPQGCSLQEQAESTVNLRNLNEKEIRV